VEAGNTPVLVHNIACKIGPYVEYGAPDDEGRVTGMSTVLTSDLIGGKTDPQVNPAGWVSGAGYNRAHLLGAQLGGSNTDPENFVTMFQYANTPVMRGIENNLAASVRGGETIQYEVNPLYEDGSNNPIPIGVYIRAAGDQGTDIEQFIMNQPKSAFGQL
jgi:DNA/RNA non-specific endonuclease